MRLSRYVASAAGVTALVFVCYRIIAVNATTVSLAMLLLVLAIATSWGLPEAIFTSILSVLGLNYFFLPPIGAFTIADPENWVALFVFLATAITVSQLSAQARRRAEEAVAGRNEVTKLYELSRAMLMDETRAKPSVFPSPAPVRSSASAIIAFFDVAASEMFGSVEGLRHRSVRSRRRGAQRRTPWSTPLAKPKRPPLSPYISAPASSAVSAVRRAS